MFKIGFASSIFLLLATTPSTAQEVKEANSQIQVDFETDEFINDFSLYSGLAKAGHTLLADDSQTGLTEIWNKLDGLDSSVKLTLPEPADGETRQRSFDSTVVIGFLYDCGKCDKKHLGVATGVVISSDGLILTNRHVLAVDAGFIHFVMTRDGKVYPVEKVLAAHEANDIALLKISATNLAYSPISANVPQPLDDLYTISHPKLNFFYASTAQVARYVERQLDNVKTRWLQIQGEFSRGSSGGPVFDSEGHVVGLMSKQFPKLAKEGHLQIMFHECVPVQVINEFLSGSLVAGKKAKSDDEKDADGESDGEAESTKDGP